MKAPSPFVSRGGIKLDGALKAFSIDPKGKICLDVGASTGGFTDCLLQREASRVYAVDVGYGDFAWKLRNDPRVVLLERQNFRYVERGQIPEPIDLAVLDLAFISLKLIFPVLHPFLKNKAHILPLVKPQFEVKASEVERGGLVTDPKLHGRVLEEIKAAGQKEGWEILGERASPILGAKGNQEYFVLFLNR